MKEKKVYKLGKIELSYGFFYRTTSQNYLSIKYNYITNRQKKLGNNRDIHIDYEENSKLIPLNYSNEKKF